jgi:hypothetical protein
VLSVLQYAAFEDNDKVYLLQEFAEGVSQHQACLQGLFASLYFLWCICLLLGCFRAVGHCLHGALLALRIVTVKTVDSEDSSPGSIQHVTCH